MENSNKVKQTAHLEDWIDRGDILMGTVTGHPILADGRFILTSRLIKLDTKGRKAETLNTFYTLGEPYNKEAV